MKTISLGRSGQPQIVPDGGNTIPHKRTSVEMQIDQFTSLLKQITRMERFLVRPDSPLMNRWDGVVVFALLFTATFTPYEVALINTDINPMFVINRMIDIIFSIDIVLCFMLMYRDANGNWVRSRKLVARRYLRGWFALDVAALPPFDVLKYVVTGEGSSSTMRIVRLFRLLKLLRLLRLPRILHRWETKFGVKHSNLIATQLMGLLCCVVHWLACGWALVAVLQDSASKTWLTVWIDGRDAPSHRCGVTTDCGMCMTGAHEDLPLNGAHRDGCWYHGDVYLASLHWSMMTVTSIGYGDIVPANTYEAAVCSVFMLIAAMTWAQIIAGICGIITTGDPIQTRYFKNTDDLNYMMSVANISGVERQRVRTFLQHNKRAMSENERKKVLSFLSPALSGIVAGATPAFIQKQMIYWTKNLSAGFIGRLVQNMDTQTYPPRETIPADDTMYVLKKGAVNLVTPSFQGSLITRSSRKTVWNEDIVVTFSHIRRLHVASTLTFVEVEALDKKTLGYVIKTDATMADRAAFRINTLWLTVFRACEYRARKGYWPWRGGGGGGGVPIPVAGVAVDGAPPSFSSAEPLASDSTVNRLRKIEADVGSLHTDVGSLLALYSGLDAKLNRICSAIGTEGGDDPLKQVKQPPPTICASMPRGLTAEVEVAPTSRPPPGESLRPGKVTQPLAVL
jgi:potassium voltage-gated channel Eag-related subfamily H protein 7